VKAIIKCVGIVLVLLISEIGIADVTATKDQFITPPDSARPHTWWHWMNGNVTKEGITADLEAMAKVGIGGAQIFNVGDKSSVNIPSKKQNGWEWKSVCIIVPAGRAAADRGLPRNMR
jgi:hypothetical protein